MMSLWINDSRASTSEIEAGVHAAKRTFENAGWHPALVNRAMLEEIDRSEDGPATQIWRDAETAAFKVAFKGWHRWPESAILVWQE